MNEHFYETGSTQPPKSRVLIVLLLVLLIFAGGIITALGILNIKLWSASSAKEESAVSLKFRRSQSSAAAQFTTPETAENAPSASLGVDTETVSPFIRAYYGLPQGVYLPRVPIGSFAAAAGILPGDILLDIEGQRITDTHMLKDFLRQYHAGDKVTLTLYREGAEFTVHLTLAEENG